MRPPLVLELMTTSAFAPRGTTTDPEESRISLGYVGRIGLALYRFLESIVSFVTATSVPTGN